jgi:hypothetical protein
MVTLIALFYAEENWRGRRVWNSYRRAVEAKGAQLQLQAFIPPPVPDEQNFAATPFMADGFAKNGNESPFARDLFALAQPIHVKGGHLGGGRPDRQFMDLQVWKAAFAALSAGGGGARPEFDPGKLDAASRAEAAPAVLDGLKVHEAAFTELQAASRRPFSRYPVRYDLDNPWGILLPHLARIRAICQRLQLRACAELAAGRPADALADIELMLYLGESIRDEPFIVSFLLRLDCIQTASQPIWEGLAEHRWSDDQLAVLQARLQPPDLFAGMQHCLEAERAAGILTAELLYRRRYELRQLVGDAGPSVLRGFALWIYVPLAPRGWFHLEQLNYASLYDHQWERAFDVEKRRVFPDVLAACSRDLAGVVAGGAESKYLQALRRHQLLAILLLPSLEKVPLRAAIAQTALDQASLACVLERIRLVHGRFPEQLTSLVPGGLPALPHDPLTGVPYVYQRESDDRFILYSVGWNQRDEGGRRGGILYDTAKGDWVWEYPR